MADLLGVTRNTVGNYMAGRTAAPVAVLRVWALRCGVPFDWLLTGETSEDDDPGDAHTLDRRASRCTVAYLTARVPALDAA